MFVIVVVVTPVTTLFTLSLVSDTTHDTIKRIGKVQISQAKIVARTFFMYCNLI